MGRSDGARWCPRPPPYGSTGAQRAPDDAVWRPPDGILRRSVRAFGRPGCQATEAPQKGAQRGSRFHHR
jgi:hypothetical protein